MMAPVGGDYIGLMAAAARHTLLFSVAHPGDPPVCAGRELASCRERELRQAAAIIDFDELHLQDRRT
jgi:hypothetical protein